MNRPAARMRFFAFCAFLLTVTWPVAAAGPPEHGPGNASAPRIVSLAPHLTELAFEAGIEDRLVGVVEWSDYPAAAQALPRIGDAFRFNLEQIVRLQTTHALAWSGGTPRAAIAQLRALGVGVEVIRIETLDQIGDAIEQLGALGGNLETAALAAAGFRARLAGFRAGQTNGVEHIPIFYQVSETPLFTLGGKHVINEVLGLCGGTNIFAGLGTEAASVDLEAVLARDPLAIVMGRDESEGSHENRRGEDAGKSNPGAGTRWQAYPGLRAVACDNILKVEPALLVRPTPRVLDGARKLCTWLDEEVRRVESPACRIDRD